MRSISAVALELWQDASRRFAQLMIAGYNQTDPNAHGTHCVRNVAEIIVKRVRMEGFVCLDYLDRASEAYGALGKWHQEGKLKYRVHVVEGLRNAPAAMNMLFDGRNEGKLIVAV